MYDHVFKGKSFRDLTPEDIASIIGQEESPWLEFKESLALESDHDKREFAKDICAFLNHDGGYVVIGAGEDKLTNKCKSLKNVENINDLEKKINDIIPAKIKEIGGFDLKTFVVDRNQILVIQVKPSQKSPHAVVNGNKCEFFKRIHKANQPMSLSEIKEACVLNSSDHDIKRRVEEGCKRLLAESKHDHELYELIHKRNPQLAGYYRGAYFALKNPHNPERHVHSAHSVREFMEKLPMKTVAVSGEPNTKDQVRALLNYEDPLMSCVGGEIHVNDWVELRDDFVAISQHGKEIQDDDFDKLLKSFEKYLRALFAPNAIENQKRIREMIREAEHD